MLTDVWPQSKPVGHADSVAARLRRIAVKYAGDTALLGDGERLSYRELDEHSNRLANRLAAHGIQAGDVVAIVAERGVRTVVSALAVVKAGAAYLPLDPEAPIRRTRDLLELANCRVALAPSHLAKAVASDGLTVVSLDRSLRVLADQPTRWDSSERSSGQLFAVIFTSGSTGRPKPVAIEDRNLLSLLDNACELMPRPGESALHVCAPQFDVAMLEIWATLLHGGRLVCHPSARPDPRAICQTVVEHEVDWTAMATTTFHQLAESGVEPLARLRMALVGGEPMRPIYARRFRAACPDTRLLNIYGPAETTVFVATYEVDRVEDDERIPIGRAIPGSRLRVLDHDGQAASLGEIGELCIAGPGVSRGYLHRPNRIGAEYVRDPDDPDVAFYRSGDLARELDDGAIELLGRIDGQVKLSGYRVDPTEIEAVLCSHPAITKAAVIGHAATAGSTQLTAYVVATGEVPQEDQLREFLASRLPMYMVPRTISHIERLPTGPTGKLDRAALAISAAATPIDPVPLNGSPMTATAALFAEVLSLPAVGEHDDFLELGGDSLMAVQLLARLRERFESELPLSAVFELRTPAALERLARDAPGRSDSKLPPLTARRHDGPVLATSGQAKALMISELADESLPYQSQGMHRILGELDIGALQRSLEEMVRRHEILRTGFVREHGVWLQRVHEPGRLKLPIEDLSGEQDPSAALDEHFRALVSERMDPSRPPLARWSLARLNGRDHALIAVEHHVVHDGVSTAVFLRELSQLYRAETSGEPIRLGAPSVQYRDFAVWQSELVDSPHGRRTLAYWREQLADPPELTLPLDAPRGARQTYRGNTLRRRLPEALAQALGVRARRWQTTPFNLMFAAYCVLLARYGNPDELMIGSGLANRRTLASEELMGMLVNTVALRVDMRGDPSARVLAERVARVLHAAQDHQDVPFERVVEHLAPARRPELPPLYQTLFSFHDSPVATTPLPGATLVPGDALANGSAKADLSVVVVKRRHRQAPNVDASSYRQIAEDGLTVVWEYNSDLFEQATAERMLDQYTRVLEQFAAEDTDRPAHTLELEETQALRLRAAGASGGYERDATIADLFERQAKRRPDAVAVCGEGCRLTYLELDRQSNRLAHRLRWLGIDRGSRVGVCIGRSSHLIVALLAIAKAGATYVPLEPDDPKDRLRRQVEMLSLPLVLSLQRHRDSLPPPIAHTLLLDDELDLGRESDTPPRSRALATDPAYLMFTSGSTGAPRAIAVPHRAISRLVRDTDYVCLDEQQTLLALAPTAFDASTFEIWGALLNGGRLALAPPGPLALADLEDVIERERVTTLWLTAGLFHRVVDERPRLLGRVRQLLAGGDVLSPDHVRRALAALPDGATLSNGYGPTEGTTFSCVHTLRHGQSVPSPVPIGRPISGSRAYILDLHGEPVPIGVAGELYVGGDGVALCYVDDRRRTAERFLQDPFDPAPGARMYRTGDNARWRSDGTIEFLGRYDRQVKLRGFRIEPAEVEALLRQHDGVVDAAVAMVERSPGDRTLVAHVVPAPGTDVSDAELRSHAARTLPSYAVPSVWNRIERMPLTRNGKVDFAALPARPSVSATVPIPAATERATDQLERRLIAIWKRTLEVDAVGPLDDFFELGGHSLLAVDLFAQIERSLGVRLPLATIFEAPTVQGLARCMREEGWKSSSGSLVTLTASGRRPPLFFVAAGDGNAVGFGALARRLGDDQPFYALQPRGMNGGARLHGSVGSMAAHYLHEIRRLQPNGPYLLGGRCLGAVVAYEIARRFERRGDEVALLAVLDSGGPLWRTRPLADGTPFDEVMSWAIRRGSVEVELAEAFTKTGTDRLLRELSEPVHVGADGTAVNRYLHEIYLKRADVRDAYPDLEGEDAMWFAGWAWTSGRQQLGLCERLLPAAARPEWEAGRARRSPRQAAAALADRVKRRLAEAIDLASAGRRDGAAQRRIEHLRALSVHAWHQHRAGSYRGKITLIRSEEFRVQPGLERWHFLDSGGVVEHHVRGTHRSMLREPDVESLAACVKTLVDDRIRA